MTTVLAEYSLRDTVDGELWIEVHVDRKLHDRIGPFTTHTERERALDDLLQMQRDGGATDLPARPQ